MVNNGQQSINAGTRQQAQLRKLLINMQSGLGGLIGTTNRMEQEIAQVLAEGGTVDFDSKIAFVTGAYARMMKDFGAVALLQGDGITVKKTPETRR